MSLNPKTMLFRVINYVNSHVNDIVQQKLKNPLSYGSYGCDILYISNMGLNDIVQQKHSTLSYGSYGCDVCAMRTAHE